VAKAIKEWLEVIKEWQKSLKNVWKPLMSGKSHSGMAKDTKEWLSLSPESLRLLTARDIKNAPLFLKEQGDSKYIEE
jgi:hypothetical protein